VLVAGERESVCVYDDCQRRLQNFHILVDVDAKLALLVRMLCTPPLSQRKVLVYFLTRACVDYFHKVGVGV
jgi:hypothetical protein